jgi:hypothetical protein
MEDVTIIYSNDFGITFCLKHNALEQISKVNLIFNGTILHFSREELVLFSRQIKTTLTQPLHCKECYKSNTCKSIVLHTPFTQVSFALTYLDLMAMEELIEGTLFEMGLTSLLKHLL